MLRNQSSGLAGLALVLVGAACSSVDSTAASSSGATATDGGVCSLQSIGLTFTRPECTECMQTSCCAATTACFSGDTECKALFTCVNACPSHGAPVVAVSDAGAGEDAWTINLGGDSGGGGGGHADAGPAPAPTDPCVDACNAMHPTAVTADSSYIGCFRGQCLSFCN